MAANRVAADNPLHDEGQTAADNPLNDDEGQTAAPADAGLFPRIEHP